MRRGRRLGPPVRLGGAWRGRPDCRKPCVVAALRQGVGLQIVVADRAGFRFRHALTHEAVLAGLLPPERALLAGRALAAIEAAHPGLPGTWCTLAAELADGAGDAERSAVLLLEAGRRDLAVGALASAEHTLARARGAGRPGRPGLCGPVDEALTEVFALSGQVDRAIETGRMLLARLGGRAERPGRASCTWGSPGRRSPGPAGRTPPPASRSPAGQPGSRQPLRWTRAPRRSRSAAVTCPTRTSWREPRWPRPRIAGLRKWRARRWRSSVGSRGSVTWTRRSEPSPRRWPWHRARAAAVAAARAARTGHDRPAPHRERGPAGAGARPGDRAGRAGADCDAGPADRGGAEQAVPGRSRRWKRPGGASRRPAGSGWPRCRWR